jgi:intracellular multiplication protein IcmP
MWANGFTLLVLILPLCVWTARRSLHTNPTNHLHYARTADYTLHSFSDEMGKIYPHVRLFRKINPTARSIDDGQYRMADTEKQFAMKHALLDRAGKDGGYRVNDDRASAVLREQVGGLWRSFRDLSKWELAVLSVLMPRIAATDNEMPDDEYKVALATTTNLVASYWEVADRTYDVKADRLDIDITQGIAAIRRYFRSPKVAKYFRKHAYVYTIIYAMLNDARSLGVLPSNELRWLRVVDRRLWLVINNVGRSVAWTEISGVYGHYVTEIKKKRAIEKVDVGNAVKGLREAVEGYRFSEDEVVRIEAHLKAEEKARMVVDPKTVAVERKTLILGALRVFNDGKQDFLEVALIAEDGSTVYSQRCQPNVPREAIERDYHLTDEDISALLKMPVSESVYKRLLELVNGQDLVAFYRAECALVPGIERSAASVRTLEDPDDGMDLRTSAVMEEVIDRSHEIHTAVDAAKVVRLLWIELRKAEMRAAQATPGAPSA